MLDAEVTVKFILSDVCFESDLVDESHFQEIVQEYMENEIAFFDEFHIVECKKIS